MPPNRFRPLTNTSDGLGISATSQSTHLSAILVANENMHKALRAPSEKQEEVGVRVITVGVLPDADVLRWCARQWSSTPWRRIRHFSVVH